MPAAMPSIVLINMASESTCSPGLNVYVTLQRSSRRSSIGGTNERPRVLIPPFMTTPSPASSFGAPRASAQTYYTYEFDWGLLCTLLTGTPDVRASLVGLDLMVEHAPTGAPDDKPYRSSTIQDMATLVRHVAQQGDRARALHAVVSVHAPTHAHQFRTYLVFDLDLRDLWDPTGRPPPLPGAPARPPPMALFQRCAHISRAGATPTEQRAVCPNCWRVCQATAVILRAVLCDIIGLRAPLLVFSGGNGMHTWFHLPPDHALAHRPMQEFLFAELLSAAAMGKIPAVVAALRAHGLEDAAPTHFDEAVTLAPARDRLTGALMGHGHCIKLPLSLHMKTGRPAMVLPLDAHQLPLFPDAGITRTASLAAYRAFLA